MFFKSDYFLIIGVVKQKVLVYVLVDCSVGVGCGVRVKNQSATDKMSNIHDRNIHVILFLVLKNNKEK